MKNSLGTALITGGAKRIGREIALNLAKMGYDLVISYNNSFKEAEEVSSFIKNELGKKCDLFKCDLSDINQTKELALQLKNNFPNWNLLINNASIFRKSRFLQESSEELFDNLNIHLISPLILAKEFAAREKENCQIINFLDKDIVNYKTSYFYYLLSKKSLAELTKMLAIELAPKVRVNAIAPGFIINSVGQKDPETETQNLITKIPLKTKGDIINIWQSVEFLINNKFINGQIIFVDGGASL